MRRLMGVMARSELPVSTLGLAAPAGLCPAASAVGDQAARRQQQQTALPIAPQIFFVSIYPDPFFLPLRGLFMAVCPVAALL